MKFVKIKNLVLKIIKLDNYCYYESIFLVHQIFYKKNSW